MQRTHHVLATVVLVCLASTGLAIGHPNHITAGPQASPDGTVVVESVFAINPAFLVLHADDGGEPGRAIGHVWIESGVQTGVEIDIYDGVWRNWTGARAVWATVHRDENDNGEFDPGSDPVIRGPSTFVGTAFPVRRSDDGRSVVVGGPPSPEAITDPAVEVDRVALETTGFLALHASEGGQAERPVGHVALDQGDYRSVTVGLDDEFVAAQNGTFRVVAIVYADDGDGTFDSERDPPITVDGEPVLTRIDLRIVEDASNGSDGGVVVTPTETSTTSAATTDSGSGSVPMAGFGLTVGVLGLIVALVVYARRRG